jgi:hypothetical protein
MASSKGVTANPKGEIKITGDHLVLGPTVKFKKGAVTKNVTIGMFGYEKRADGEIEGFKDLEVGDWTLEWTNVGDTNVRSRLRTSAFSSSRVSRRW